MATRFRLGRSLPVLCLLGCVVAAAAELRAQSFVGLGPVRQFTLPGEPRGETVPLPASVGAPTVSQPETPSAGETKTPDGLRRLPVTTKGFRFAGEWSQAEWPIYLTATQARRTAQFRLAFLSAISVMPEGSQLTLAINDVVVARTRLAAPDMAASDAFAIPAGLLKPGFNAIRIQAEQRHRVDCSLAATYELWTALDPARTGLMLAGDAIQQGFETQADIAAVPLREDGAAPIRIVATGKLTPQSAGRALKAAQLAALAGHWLQPVVDFSAAAAAGEPGLDLAIGTVADLAARLDMVDFGAVVGPRRGFLPARAGRAPTFVVTGATVADLDTALAQWSAERLALAATGSGPGLRALANQSGFRASGRSERIAFGQAGLPGTEFSGRMLRLGLDVAMPADFLPAGYDRMALNLAGTHSADLTAAARILVEVNGRNAGTQLLARGGARELDRNQIFLPLGLMRPGLNRIEITAQLPAQADEACLAQSAQTRRIQILDRSELVLPRIARIGRAPELAMLAAGGLPFARDGAKPILYVPTPDRQTMAAAATLATRLGVAAGRPIDFSFAMTAPALDAGEVLMIAAAPMLEPALIRAAGIDPERLRQAWQRDGETARDPGTPERPGDGEATARRCLLPQAPAAPARIEAAAPGEPGFSFASLGLRASLSAQSFWRGAPPEGASPEEDVVSARAVLLVAQDFPGERMGNLWTIVTAPDATRLKAGVECLAHPQVWNRLGGRISALGQDEAISFVEAGEGQRLVATQGFDIANSRLVAAGWLSLNPFAYVGLALLLVIGLAASTLWLVLNSGRRQE